MKNCMKVPLAVTFKVFQLAVTAVLAVQLINVVKPPPVNFPIKKKPLLEYAKKYPLFQYPDELRGLGLPRK